MPDDLNPLEPPAPTLVVEAPTTEETPTTPPRPEEPHPELPADQPEQVMVSQAGEAPETVPAPQESEPADSPEPVNPPPQAEENPEDAPTPAPPPPENKKKWYVVKVQSGREDSIKESIERRVKIEGLEEYYGQIVIPVDPVTEMRRGKRVKKEHKRYPGYLFVEVEYNNDILYLFRETSGVGDFVGHTTVKTPEGEKHKPPIPMSEREVERMLRISPHPTTGEHVAATPTTTITRPPFEVHDRLRVIEGTFAGMEGEAKEINPEKGQVKVELTIFGRAVPVDLEYWQVEKL